MKASVIVFFALILLLAFAAPVFADIVVVNEVPRTVLLQVTSEGSTTEKLLKVCTRTVVSGSGSITITVKSRDGKKHLCEGYFKSGDMVSLRSGKDKFYLQKVDKRDYE